MQILIWRNEMKRFRINVRWILKLFHMARQQEVERLYPIGYFLPRLSFANERIPVGLVIGTRPIAGRCSNPSASTGNPSVTRMMLIQAFTLRVHRISEVTETMLGPSVFVIVNALLKQDGISVIVAQEKRITFGGNCQAVNLPLFPCFEVVVVAFNFKDRA
jgi:hypothetical protein